MRGIEARIPGDLSSAAFFLCAAALFPGSQLRDSKSADESDAGAAARHLDADGTADLGDAVGGDSRRNGGNAAGRRRRTQGSHDCRCGFCGSRSTRFRCWPRLLLILSKELKCVTRGVAGKNGTASRLWLRICGAWARRWKSARTALRFPEVRRCTARRSIRLVTTALRWRSRSPRCGPGAKP